MYPNGGVQYEGVNCFNFSCKFYDDTGMYEQKCSAGDEDGSPLIADCERYIPEYDGH
jgi:hypothetical protein